MADEYAPTFAVPSIEEIVKEKFSTARLIRLLWRGRESFSTIFDAVRKAERIICLEFYIFRNDETGSELAEILKQKSLDGVRVYLLYDHFGSFGTPLSFWDSLKKAGVRTAASRPFKWIFPFHYVHRNHRKLIVIDDQKAFTGGLNIANEYSGFHLRLKGRKWRDTGIMLEGPVAHELFKSFRKNWFAWAGEIIESPAEAIQEVPGTGCVHGGDDCNIPVMPIFVNSAKGRRKMRRLLYYSINHARKSISLTTAYFTPSRRMVETLEQAVARGVSVRLLVPGITDFPPAAYAGRAFFTRLLKAGVEIYAYAGRILHAKTSLFDGCWGIIGSTNLDFQSLRYNDEGNVGILDLNFSSKLNDLFEEDIKHSSRIDPIEWRGRPIQEKLKEHFSHSSGEDFRRSVMSVKETYEVIIVGGGPAGLSAGLYCKRAALKTVLFEKGLLGGQIAISKEVENYPGMESITGFDLAEKLVHQARSFGLEVIQEEVAAVNAGPDLHSVRLANGDLFHTVALIIAAGGTLRKLGIPGEAEYLGTGVSYCATCDGFFFRDKTVLVVGGGDTAVEESIYLSKLAKKVYLVHRRDKLRASNILQSRLLSEPRIEVIWNSIITEIKGDGRTVNAVSLKNIETGKKGELQAEGVFILIGYSPNNQLVPSAVRIDNKGLVITDEKCETSVPGIFAVGDLRRKFANQIVVAAADGCTAALAAAHYVETRKAGGRPY